MLSLLVVLCETRTGVKNLSLQSQPFMSTDCPNFERKKTNLCIIFLQGNLTHMCPFSKYKAIKFMNYTLSSGAERWKELGQVLVKLNNATALKQEAVERKRYQMF